MRCRDVCCPHEKAREKPVCLRRPVRLRLASLCFAKASSASLAKELLHAGKNRCALKSGEPADRFEEQSSVMSPRSFTRPTIRSIEKACCRDVRCAHEKAREKPVTPRQRASLPPMLFGASLPRMFFLASPPVEGSLTPCS